MTRLASTLPRLTPRAFELLTKLRRPPTLRERIVGREAEDVEILDQLARAAEPRLVAELPDTVFDSRNAVARAAAIAVEAALVRTPLQSLSRLEEECRHQSSYWRPNSPWLALRPVQLSRFDASQPGALGVAALTSFHPNGYVRETAVALLDAFSDATELAYLLLRLNDWVPQVADAATAAVTRRLVTRYADAFVDHLPLMVALERTERRDHAPVLARIYAFLRDDAQRYALDRGRKSSDRTTRRLCYRLAREAGHGDAVDLLRDALADPDASLRFAAIVQTIEVVEAARLEAVLSAALDDTFAPVRRVAIDTGAARLSPSIGVRWLERALMDPGKSVREVARFHLKRIGAPIDVAEYYRHAVRREQSPRALTIALAGLRETGSAPDAELALGLLDHPRPLVRRAAVRTVGVLDAESHLQRLVTMLRDPSRGVTRTASETLMPHAGAIGVDGIRTVLGPPAPPNRVHAIALATGLGKWSSLVALLEFVDDPEPAVRRAVMEWLEKWLARQNRSYAQPTPGQLAAANRTLATKSASIDAPLREAIEQVVAYWSPK